MQSSKNNNTRQPLIVLAYTGIIALAAYILFTLTGFRTEVANMRVALAGFEMAAANRESRLCVLEENIRQIRLDLTEIKQSVKDTSRGKAK